MTKVVLEDAQVVAALDAIHQRSELRDISGRLVGFFVPGGVGTLITYRGLKSPLPREELERRIRDETNSAKPLAQFWDDMRKKHPEKFE